MDSIAAQGRTTDRQDERGQGLVLAEDYHEQDGCNFRDDRFAAFRSEVLEILRDAAPAEQCSLA